MTRKTIPRSTFRAFWDVTIVRRMVVLPRLAAALLVLLSGLSGPVRAQSDDRQAADSQSRVLASAKATLARRPEDIDALRMAARAALKLGLIDQALGYAERAETVWPGDGGMVAVRASAALAMGDLRGALLLFVEAEAKGADPSDYAADRGLAYALYGDAPSAAHYYRLAMQAAPSSEVTRRYALTLAVLGDFAAGDALLRPLLAEQDMAAWRVRAFMLALAGRTDEATALLHATLPEQLADDLAPYMAAMPRLTRAEQAAAALLGQFPVRDDLGISPAPAGPTDVP